MMIGAVDIFECPYRWAAKKARDATLICKCGCCAVCGFPLHTAIHGPFYGRPAGSEPYGHQFVCPGQSAAIEQR